MSIIFVPPNLSVVSAFSLRANQFVRRRPAAWLYFAFSPMSPRASQRTVKDQLYVNKNTAYHNWARIYTRAKGARAQGGKFPGAAY
jgi:hypothetical protein